MGFGFRFDLFQIMFSITFFLILAVFIITIGKSLIQWNRNNHAPRLTVDASIVAKRTNITRHRNGANHMHHSHTTYFATFQIQSGDRMELQVAGHEYGLLVEGDKGRLTFQGTRFLGFERTL